MATLRFAFFSFLLLKTGFAETISCNVSSPCVNTSVTFDTDEIHRVNCSGNGSCANMSINITDGSLKVNCDGDFVGDDPGYFCKNITINNYGREVTIDCSGFSRCRDSIFKLNNFNDGTMDILCNDNTAFSCCRNSDFIISQGITFMNCIAESNACRASTIDISNGVMNITCNSKNGCRNQTINCNSNSVCRVTDDGSEDVGLYSALKLRKLHSQNTCESGSTCICSTNYNCYTQQPTHDPTGLSSSPSQFPTTNPTEQPTDIPSLNPSISPSKYPSKQRTEIPLPNPTKTPSKTPSKIPSKTPTKIPTVNPTKAPTKTPSNYPSKNPTNLPTQINLTPSKDPSNNPTNNPTQTPSNESTLSPSIHPIDYPTGNPTITTNGPSNSPTGSPTSSPTPLPSNSPSTNPSSNPSKTPSQTPSQNPSFSPTETPSKQPTNRPTNEPTNNPSKNPTISPSLHPTPSQENPIFFPPSINNPTQSPSTFANKGNSGLITSSTFADIAIFLTLGIVLLLLIVIISLCFTYKKKKTKPEKNMASITDKKINEHKPNENTTNSTKLPPVPNIQMVYSNTSPDITPNNSGYNTPLPLIMDNPNASSETSEKNLENEEEKHDIIVGNFETPGNDNTNTININNNNDSEDDNILKKNTGENNNLDIKIKYDGDTEGSNDENNSGSDDIIIGKQTSGAKSTISFVDQLQNVNKGEEMILDDIVQEMDSSVSIIDGVNTKGLEDYDN